MSTQTTGRRCPRLTEEHRKLGATFTTFGGWQMPLKYGSELAEHKAVRTAAGLFDLSHMGEIMVEGPEAAKFLNYALVGNLGAVAVGRATYSLMCQKDGGILDDLVAYRLARETYLVVSNAGNTPDVVASLTERAEDGPAGAFDVTITDASAGTALIAVQGPKAQEILLNLVHPRQHQAVRDLKYYAVSRVELGLDTGPTARTTTGPATGTHNLLVARTGYTGEDGFEIYLPNETAPALWQGLLSAGRAGGLVPAGLAARDSLRLEAGMPLYGNELSLTVTPFEAGLGRLVSLTKEGSFVGRAALEARQTEERARQLVGLRGLGRRAARPHYPVLKDGTVVGGITSGIPSPTLGYPVAMAYVDAELAVPGTSLHVDVRGTPEPFEVVPLPFYQRGNRSLH